MTNDDLTHQHTAIHLLAILVHESGRASVESGDTLAHTVDPAKTRPFTEWNDLAPEVKAGRRLTAQRLLERFIIGEVFPDFGSGETVDSLAPAIHEAERAAVERGLTVVKLNRPWTNFDALPSQAQAGRRRQARYLLERMFIVERR